MFLACWTFAYVAISMVVTFALSRLLVNSIINKWFSRMSDQADMKQLVSYGGAVYICILSAIVSIAESAAFYSTVELILCFVLGWLSLVLATSLFLVIFRSMGRGIDALTERRR